MGEKVSLPYATLVGLLAIASVLVGGSLVSSRQQVLQQLREREQLYAQRVSGLRAELDEARQQAASLERQAALVNREVDEARRRNEALEAEVAQVRSRNEALQDEAAQLRRAQNEAQALAAVPEAELASLRENLARLQEARQGLEQELNQFRLEKEQADSAVQRLSQQYASLQAERDHLAAQLEQAAGAAAGEAGDGEGGYIELAPILVGSPPDHIAQEMPMTEQGIAGIEPLVVEPAAAGPLAVGRLAAGLPAAGRPSAGPLVAGRPPAEPTAAGPRVPERPVAEPPPPQRGEWIVSAAPALRGAEDEPAAAPGPARDEEAEALLPSQLTTDEPTTGYVEYVDEVNHFAIINKGERDGVIPGTRLDVLRDGSKFGELQVIEVRDEVSAADIVNLVGGRGVQAGDAVVMR